MTLDILEPLEAESASVQKRHTILIVDDDEALAEALSRRLKQQGFDTLTADCGRAGLAQAKSDRPSLIVLDVRLPDIDGLAICQQLADSPETCGIPVIILSGMARPDIIRRSRAAGCTYFVRKPYDPNAMLVLIRQAIDEAGGWA
jgi:CheY-like chemotaxis protein